MLGLFGTLNLTARSLQVQQQGIEVAGHNMANVNNPAYARQRISIETSSAITTDAGLEGTGADVTRIKQIRDSLLDNQLVRENSITGSLEAQQQAMQYAQSDLGQQIDRNATGAEGTAAAAGTGAQHGIGDSISDLFNSFQSLSTQPSSITERDIVLNKAAELADRFQQTDARLAALSDSLNVNVETDVAEINNMLGDIARLNEQISRAEMAESGIANDLRDTRQAKLEELAKVVKFDALPANHSINISIGGVTMVDETVVREQLEAYDAGSGRTLVRGSISQTAVDVTGGHLHGLIETRDGTLQTLRNNLSTLAETLITEVNRLHQTGFGKDGSTGLNFFEGTDASNISVNQDLIDNPARLAASDTDGAVGNNGIILALAQLAKAPQAALNNQTFSQNYSRVVADLGESLSSLNEQATDQSVVFNMLKAQRDSVSAVSLDEEMTDLVKYQRAYQASAQLVNVIDELLETVLAMV